MNQSVHLWFCLCIIIIFKQPKIMFILLQILICSTYFCFSLLSSLKLLECFLIALLGSPLPACLMCLKRTSQGSMKYMSGVYDILALVNVDHKRKL